MDLRELASFAGNVVLLFTLGIVYVAGLTVGTIATGVHKRFSAIMPSGDREQDRPTF